MVSLWSPSLLVVVAAATSEEVDNNRLQKEGSHLPLRATRRLGRGRPLPWMEQDITPNEEADGKGRDGFYDLSSMKEDEVRSCMSIIQSDINICYYTL